MQQGSDSWRLRVGDWRAICDVQDIADGKTARDTESFPAEFADRLLSGKSPLLVWRNYRSMTLQPLADACGVVARNLSRRRCHCRLHESEQIFLAGLQHKIGRLVFFDDRPNLCREVLDQATDMAHFLSPDIKLGPGEVNYVPVCNDVVWMNLGITPEEFDGVTDISPIQTYELIEIINSK